jgi:hypothetical protein
VLARLAPILIAEVTRMKSKPTDFDGPAMQELPPDLPLEEAERLLASLEADRPLTDNTSN